MDKKKNSCFKCEYFYITWDKNFPRGCKAYEFKGKQIPSDYVLHVTGQKCMAFKKKNKK